MIYKVKKVNHPHDIVTSVPGSKSITNRALLIAALASGSSVLKGCLFSDDSRHFIDALIRLGFPVLVDEDKRKITITGFGGRIPKNEAEIDVGSAGTAARFLTALLGLSKGRYHIVSSEQMKKRPMKDLLVSLEKLGAHIEYDENEYHFPFTIGNTGEYADTVDINVDKSSQFLSALLISAIVMEKNFTINVTGTHGMAYVEMTRLMMKQFGLDVMQDKKNNSFIIPKKAAYESLDYDIEPDVSAACYFYAMSPLLHVKSKVMGVHQNSLQAEGPKSQLQRTTMMVLAVTLHNIPEGMAVGVVYAGYLAGTAQITAAGALALHLGIAIQNFPEGAIISMPLRAEGMKKGRAFWGGVLSGIVEPIGAVLTILAAGIVVPALPYLLSFAAGAMLYVVVEELIPEMSQGQHSNVGTVFFAVGFSVMMVLDVALG